MRIAEGEDEHVQVRFGDVTAVPRKRSVSTKKIVVIRADDCECGSFVVAMLVEVRSRESIPTSYNQLLSFPFSPSLLLSFSPSPPSPPSPPLSSSLMFSSAPSSPLFFILWLRRYIHCRLVKKFKPSIGKPFLDLVSILHLIYNAAIPNVQKVS